MHRASLVSFESLEGRKLLSASLVKGVLTIEGTRHGDKMEISLVHDDPMHVEVRVNDHVDNFAVADITRGIDMSGGNGSDKMVVDETNGEVHFNVTMHGGNGCDM